MDDSALGGVEENRLQSATVGRLTQAVGLVHGDTLDAAVVVLDAELAKGLIAHTPSDEQDLLHAGRKRPSVQNLTLAGAWMLRTVISAWPGNSSSAGLIRDDNGRPFSSTKRPFISMAHDENTLAIAFASDASVGVDVEPLSRDLGKAVVDLLRPLGRRDALVAWTTYEAIAKADGRGIALPVTDLLPLPRNVLLSSSQGVHYSVTHRVLSSGSLMCIASARAEALRLGFFGLGGITASVLWS